MIAQREAGVVAAAGDAAAQPRGGRALEFHPVFADGVFLNDKEVYLDATAARRRGFHVLTPLREPEGRIVFVDRGFVPTS